MIFILIWLASKFLFVRKPLRPPPDGQVAETRKLLRGWKGHNDPRDTLPDAWTKQRGMS